MLSDLSFNPPLGQAWIRPGSKVLGGCVGLDPSHGAGSMGAQAQGLGDSNPFAEGKWETTPAIALFALRKSRRNESCRDSPFQPRYMRDMTTWRLHDP